ncbi:MAG: metallophosphoesterase [Oscillospiraceae bacterium]|nr:metallophosphoesterase [Oscillospiraceae bacterium]
MREYRKIENVFKSSAQIDITGSAKLVFFSDCHRGQGDNIDSFSKNHNAYIAALRHYYSKGFTYFELGDGDELWENREFKPIADTYSGVFKELMRFHQKGRLFMLYGNHDHVKKNKKWARQNLFSYYNEREGRAVPMFPGITIYEGIVLRHLESGGKILLIHGHQADFFNYTLAPLAKFLVRYVWRPLEAVGIKDPTSTSENRSKKRMLERILSSWSKKESVMLIAGHSHRTMFPKPGEAPYFNDGCCVHPRHVTAIEIASGLITLVKWSVEARADGVLHVQRKEIAGPHQLSDYFVSRTAFVPAQS